ncbi:MAG: triosephosphate isomerase [Solirubrobacterales bacterium]|jgi:triosephosphate isomerase|nr:triosephosphate isomerase [Solirubrobacterales bacterium]
MADRRPYIAANWKMHKTIAEAERFLDAFLPAVEPLVESVDVVLCPPFLALQTTVEACRGKRIGVAAQNAHEQAEGAFTGEVSLAMLAETGVSGVILGHSERRQLFAETDEALARKLPAALAAGLEPILCVGESESEREAGETEAVLKRQLDADLAGLGDDQLGEIVIAYEPIWAIGTGQTATTEQAQETIAVIRARIAERDADAAAATRILYGGSVKPANAAELLAQPDIDGALVGGASLDPEDFLAIVAAATV